MRREGRETYELELLDQSFQQRLMEVRDGKAHSTEQETLSNEVIVGDNTIDFAELNKEEFMSRRSEGTAQSCTQRKIRMMASFTG